MREREFDIVIIGSGSGGGVMAAELSELCGEGVRIAVLEWGPRLRKQDYTGRELEMVGRLYYDSGGFFTKDQTMTDAFCKAYGGCTTVYTGTSFIIKEKTLKKWGVEDLGWDEMKRRSLKYYEANNLHEENDLALINDNNKLFKMGCENLGWTVEKFPVNTKGCRGSGLCNLGCPHLAKQGTHTVQLPAAEKNGVTVVTNCKVEKIGDRECFATVGEYPGFGEQSVWEPGHYRIKAKVVVVCGGTINTCALLLRSGFSEKLPEIGKCITLHPAMIMAGLHDRPVTNFVGHPKTYCCEKFSETDGFLLETCFYFPFTTAKSCIGFGKEHAELMSGIGRMQQIIALAWDEPRPENTVTISKDGSPILDYRLSQKSYDTLHKALLAGTRIFFAAGASRVHAPAGRKFFIDRSEAGELEKLIPRSGMLPGKLSTTSAHVMGGCRMGKSPSDSVTDSRGRVHGIPWLYVADASLFPKCSEANPYITIMALADRVAETVKNDFRENLNK